MSTRANPLTGMEFSPLPLPQSNPQPDAPPTPQPGQPLPPEAGYARKTGQAANIISNFLQGMAAGKAYKEQKLQKQAQTEVTNAQYQYQFLQGIASDPDQTQDKRDQAAKLLPGAWQDMISAYQKYIAPEPPAKGSKKPGIGSRIKQGVKKTFTAEQPQLISEQQFEMLKKMAPVGGMPQQPTAEQKDAATKAQQDEDVAQRTRAIQGEIDDTNKLIAAGGLNDPDKKQQILANLSIIQNMKGTLDPKDLPDRTKDELDKANTELELMQTQLKTKVVTDAAAAYGKMKAGQPLTAGEQSALDLFMPPGQAPDPMSIFMGMVGQKYTDPLTGQSKVIGSKIEAYQAYVDTELANSKSQAQMEQSIQQAPLRNAISNVLQASDPNHQVPTQAQIDQYWLQMQTTNRGSATNPGDMYPTAAQKDAVQNSMAGVATMNNGSWKKFFRDRTPHYKDAQGNDRQSGASDFVMMPRENFSVDDQKEYDKAAQEVAHELQDRGLTWDQISTIIGKDEADRLMQMSAPPANPSAQQTATPSAGGKKKKFKITATDPSGKSQTFSSDDFSEGATADAIKAELTQNKWTNVTVDESQ
jgi:hypothetical protein